MSNVMNRLGWMLVAATFFIPGLAPAQSGTCHGSDNENCFVLWAEPAEIPALVNSYGLTVVAQLDAATPDVVLVQGPSNVLPESTLEAMSSDPNVLSVELLEVTAVTEAAGNVDLNQSYATILESLDDQGEHVGEMLEEFTASLWTGYAQQPATTLVGLHEAHAFLADDREQLANYGSGIVAVIDTGVDPGHPILQDKLVPGYDFILDQAGIASEWESLAPLERAAVQSDLEMIADQSYATILEGAGDAEFVNPSLGPILDQSYATILEAHELPPAFGHGTMVAGLIRLAAPGAQIMPLRVFDGDGVANVFDVSRAIHWATDNGAHVINMSFSTTVNSPELMRAVNYAHRNGVVCVAAAGNTNGRLMRFPAGFGNVIGVTSSDLQDALSPFSNRGADVVYVTAPGEGVISTYPGGGFAAAWGTSFSTALVSGSVALLHQLEKQGKISVFYPTDFSRASFTLGGSAAAGASSDWGRGRLDVRKSVENRVKMPGGMK